MLRRAMKGELPFQKEAMKAIEALMTPSFDEIDTDAPFAVEKELLKNLKTLYLVVSGAAAQKFMDKIVKEQETLLALADIAIQIFAIESAVLRAEKNLGKVTEKKAALMADAVKVFTFDAVEIIAKAARKAAFFVEEGDNLMMILSGIRRFTKYDATGLLQAKRNLAAAAIEAEKYVF
jgi:hypothetical protein